MDYWDDLINYGAEQSFKRNIGITLEEFYVSFSDFLVTTGEEQKSIIYNQVEQPSYPIYEDGVLIPDLTDAGQKTCLDNGDLHINALCVEILYYSGVHHAAVKSARSGVQALMSRYITTKNDITVDWDGFGGGEWKQNYVGFVLWHTDISDRQQIQKDLCVFRFVTNPENIELPSSDSFCADRNQKLLEKNSVGGAQASGAYPVHNGSIVIASEKMWDSYIPSYSETLDDPALGLKDFRKVAAHELFHIYQVQHVINMDRRPRDQIANPGPLWLIEGSADFAALRVSSLEGWLDWDRQMGYLIDVSQQVLENYPSLSISIIQTFEDSSYIRTQPYGYVLKYTMGTLATAYAISISSHESVMIDYWDDLSEHGPEKSFERNVGLTLEEFYLKFEEFLDMSNVEQLSLIPLYPESSDY